MMVVTVNRASQPERLNLLRVHLARYGIEPVVVEGVEAETKTAGIMAAMRQAVLKALEMGNGTIIMQDDVRLSEIPQATRDFTLYLAPYAYRDHYCPLCFTAPPHILELIAEAWDNPGRGSACYHWRYLARHAALRPIAYRSQPVG